MIYLESHSPITIQFLSISVSENVVNLNSFFQAMECPNSARMIGQNQAQQKKKFFPETALNFSMFNPSATFVQVFCKALIKHLHNHEWLAPTFHGCKIHT